MHGGAQTPTDTTCTHLWLVVSALHQRFTRDVVEHVFLGWDLGSRFNQALGHGRGVGGVVTAAACLVDPSSADALFQQGVINCQLDNGGHL